jgi:hypothetical protein
LTAALSSPWQSPVAAPRSSPRTSPRFAGSCSLSLVPWQQAAQVVVAAVASTVAVPVAVVVLCSLGGRAARLLSPPLSARRPCPLRPPSLAGTAALDIPRPSTVPLGRAPLLFPLFLRAPPSPQRRPRRQPPLHSRSTIPPSPQGFSSSAKTERAILRPTISPVPCRTSCHVAPQPLLT